MDNFAEEIRDLDLRYSNLEEMDFASMGLEDDDDLLQELDALNDEILGGGGAFYV